MAGIPLALGSAGERPHAAAVTLFVLSIATFAGVVRSGILGSIALLAMLGAALASALSVPGDSGPACVAVALCCVLVVCSWFEDL